MGFGSQSAAKKDWLSLDLADFPQWPLLAQTLLFGLCSLLIIVACYFIWLQPINQSTEQQERRQERSIAQLKKTSPMLNSAPRLNQQNALDVLVMQQLANNASQRYAKSWDDDQLLRVVTDLQSSHAVKFLELKPRIVTSGFNKPLQNLPSNNNDAQSNADSQRGSARTSSQTNRALVQSAQQRIIALDVSMQGEYLDVAGFLKALLIQEPSLRVTSLQIARNNKLQRVNSIVLRARIEALDLSRQSNIPLSNKALSNKAISSKAVTNKAAR